MPVIVLSLLDFIPIDKSRLETDRSATDREAPRAVKESIKEQF
jgi:hypothetical protein